VVEKQDIATIWCKASTLVALLQLVPSYVKTFPFESPAAQNVADTHETDMSWLAPLTTFGAVQLVPFVEVTNLPWPSVLAEPTTMQKVEDGHDAGVA